MKNQNLILSAMRLFIESWRIRHGCDERLELPDKHGCERIIKEEIGRLDRLAFAVQKNMALMICLTHQKTEELVAIGPFVDLKDALVYLINCDRLPSNVSSQLIDISNKLGSLDDSVIKQRIESIAPVKFASLELT